MATFIKTLKKGDDVYAPRTVAEAVYLSDGLTDVETALTDLETAIDNIDLDASSISNTPAGDIAATTVQNAINELDSEKVAKITNSGTVVHRIWSGTQAQYDAISVKDPNTLYFVS